jgi:Common central domain of tyrosinase
LRKNQMNMTMTEIKRFVKAIRRMKDLGIYDQFVLLHSITYPEIRYGRFANQHKCVEQAEKYRLSEECLNWAHKGNLFLPWHRQFLLEFEKQLLAIDPEVTLPYWGWGSSWPGQESIDPKVNHLFADVGSTVGERGRGEGGRGRLSEWAKLSESEQSKSWAKLS